LAFTGHWLLITDYWPLITDNWALATDHRSLKTEDAMKTGQDILTVARPHAEANDTYVFGALTPVNHTGPGPWDCSKFVSAMVYQGGGVIYGCEDNAADPGRCYGGTVYWERDVLAKGIMISPALAAAIPGAAVLRFVQGDAEHHIVLSDGKGGTIEANCTRLGTIFSTLHGRRWSTGILVPGVDYGPRPQSLPLAPPAGGVWRLGPSLMRGKEVFDIQCRLKNLGYLPTGKTDWVYGPETAAAVADFQKGHGVLVVDGECGPATLAALEIQV
jgi:hypothetical protein